MSGSIYQVGVHLMARDGVSGVLANISKSVLGLHGSVEHLQKGFAGLNVALIGAGMMAAGMAIGHATEKIVEHSFEMQHWKAQMMAAGATSSQVANAVSRSWEVAGKNLNTTASDNLKNIMELNKATGNWAESTRLLPVFAQAETVLSSVKADGLRSRMTGNSMQTLNFARGLEELGVTQMGKTEEEREGNIKKYAQEFIKTMISSRGLFDGNQLYALTNNAGGAGQNWDMRMATTVAPILSEIMKAGKMGNADYMALKSYQGGHITGDAAEALFKYHLVKSSDLKRDSKGKVTGLNANTDFAKGMDTNLWDWSTRILEQLKKSGMDVTDQHKMNGLINEIGSNKSTTMLMRAILEPLTRLQIEKDFASRDRVTDDAAGIQQANDPFLKIQALQKKWDDFLTVLGGPLVDPAMKALDYMTKKLNEVNQWLVAHPDMGDKIGKSLIAVSVGLTALGAALIGGTIIAAIGTGGWLVAGIIALGAAFVAFGPSDIMSKIGSGMKELGGEFKDFWAEINKENNEWPNKIVGGIKDAFVAIVNAFVDGIKGMINSLAKMFPNFGKGMWNQAPGVPLVDPSSGVQLQSYHGGSAEARAYNMAFRDPTAGTGTSTYDAIMRAEGTTGQGYNTVLGNGAYGVPNKPLTSMTLAEAYAFGNQVRHNQHNHFNSSALGAFQIVGSTMRLAARALGYDMNTTKFDEEHQRAMANWIRIHQGLGAWEGFKSHPNEIGNAVRGLHVPPPPKGKTPVVIQANLHMDRKKIASQVITALLDSASGPSRGSQMPDDSRANYGTGSSFNPSFA